ncbi:Protein suppresor of gene silencing 3 [Apostasia shenzhenica]|uniref:Protein suppresor of gene silencing 3 n=1 Tax=Apostasia shenzhenica TaxID=1088818 RepID=A0A2I0B3M5_9ASPA|nr:Protein suppresor of gene silencing 3 [Apostasia shenzhenica]
MNLVKMRGKGRTRGAGKDHLPRVKSRHSEWHREPLPHRSRRSRSPVMGNWKHDSPQKRPLRSPDCRIASLEHQPVHPSRFCDRGKEVVHDRPPLPEHYYYPRSPREFSSFGKEEFFFPHEHMFSDQPSLGLSWKPSQRSSDREFPLPVADTLTSSYLGSEGQGMLLKKSTLFKEGSGPRLSSDNPMGSNFLSSERLSRSGNHFGIGLQQREMLHYHDQPWELYDDVDWEKLYAKDSSFPVMPPPQPRPFSSTSSSITFKEDFQCLQNDCVSEGLTTGIGRYQNEALEHNAYSKLPIIGSSYRDWLDEPQLYGSNELARRGHEDHQYHGLNEPHKRLPCVSENKFGDITGSNNFGCSSEMINDVNSCKRNLSESVLLKQQVYLHQDVASRNHGMRRVQDESLKKSERWHGGLQMKSSRDHEAMPFHESSSFENDLISLTYRERPRTSLSHHDVDEYWNVINTHGRSNMDGMRDCDIERVVQRNHAFNEKVCEIYPESMFADDRNAFLRMYSPSGSEDMWLTEDPVELSPLKSTLLKHGPFRRFSKGMSRSDTLMLSSGASSLIRKNDHHINLKRRLKQGHSDFNGPLFSERRQDVFRSFKYRKRVTNDKLDAHGRGMDNSGSHYINDTVEGSEEFKQQVQKAFLYYSKVLNERACRESFFGDQGSSSKLLCAVCGSLSKEFMDARSLVTHAYYSLKLNLRTKHLGFHKALCVVMGWKSDVPPGNSMSIPKPEARSLREDLILWPPLVIIHNISIGDKRSTRVSKVVSVETMENILKDLGFGAGKSSVCVGKPANKSTFVVKFMPTFSGLQEAEKLHEHFTERNHGKEEYEQIVTREHPYQNNIESRAEVGEFLYGYMAIAEDLGKLAPEIKKRSLVKSKKDIKAIADAPLSTD